MHKKEPDIYRRLTSWVSFWLVYRVCGHAHLSVAQDP